MITHIDCISILKATTIRNSHARIASEGSVVFLRIWLKKISTSSNEGECEGLRLKSIGVLIFKPSDFLLFRNSFQALHLGST